MESVVASRSVGELMAGRYVIEADGGSEGIGPAAYGTAVATRRMVELSRRPRDTSVRRQNNVAEYTGLVTGCRSSRGSIQGCPREAGWTRRLVME